MPVEVIMPKVDMDMTSGKLSVWHVAEGDSVARGAVLFDIETDKAAMEVESPASGRVHHISAVAGAVVAVGQPVAWIYAEGEAVAPAPALPVSATTAPPTAPAPDQPTNQPAPPQAGLRATPAARRMARDGAVALAAVPGSGPHGRIGRDDVAAWLEAGHLGAPAPTGWSPQTGDLHITHDQGGTGAPIMLIHGFAADSSGWQPLERALGNERAIWRIDLPCHGKSPRLRIDSFQALARRVVAAFDRLDLPPVHLVGHSLGGAVALALADIRPRRIASLNLIAPAGLGPETDFDTLLGIARASRIESLTPWLRRLAATPDGISDDFARAAMRARTDPQMRAAQIDMARALFPDAVPGFDLSAALSRVRAPARIIWGRQDRIIPWRHALQAPGAIALHLCPGIGHIPHVEHPELVAGILEQHMAATGAHSHRVIG